MAECGEVWCGISYVCLVDTCLCAISHLPPTPDGACQPYEELDLRRDRDGVNPPYRTPGGLNSSQPNMADSSRSTLKFIPNNSSTSLRGGKVPGEGGTSLTIIILGFLGSSVFVVLFVGLLALLCRMMCLRYTRNKNRRQGSTFSGRNLLAVMETGDDTPRTEQGGPSSPATREGLQGLLMLDSRRLRIVSHLGAGAFGTVHKGILAREEEEAVEEGGAESAEGGGGRAVAVKTLWGGYRGEARRDLLAEWTAMARLQHRNVATFYGVVFSDEAEAVPRLVTEFALHGDLATALRKNDPALRDREGICVHIKEEERLWICQQVASGMEYLSGAHFVHRDLAARNCLLMEGLHVKISDFGLAGDYHTSKSSYKVEGPCSLPVRWMSPEVISYGLFSVRSDVWAFGVLLWEVYTFARQPYLGLSNTKVMSKISRGVVLERPDGCPERVHEVMRGCWRRNPRNRLPFPAVSRLLQGLPDDTPRMLAGGSLVFLCRVDDFSGDVDEDEDGDEDEDVDEDETTVIWDDDCPSFADGLTLV